MKTILSLSLLFSQLIFAAAPKEEILIFRNFSRTANDLKFRASTALFLADVSVERAKYELGLVTKLNKEHVASYFEYSDAIIKLQRANFAYQTALAQQTEAEADEKIWRHHADSLENDRDDPKTIALLNIELRKKQLKVAQDFLTFAHPTVDELTEQYARMKTMYATGAVSTEAFRTFEILAIKAQAFVPAVEANVVRAKKRLAESEEELRQFE